MFVSVLAGRYRNFSCVLLNTAPCGGLIKKSDSLSVLDRRPVDLSFLIFSIMKKYLSSDYEVFVSDVSHLSQLIYCHGFYV